MKKVKKQTRNQTIWKNIPLQTLPSEGLFYPPGTKITIHVLNKYKNGKKLIRKKYINNNSLFSIEANFITDVFDNNGNKLKFNYKVSDKLLIIFGDYEGIYVLYK